MKSNIMQVLILILITIDLILTLQHKQSESKPLAIKWDGSLKQEPNGDIIKLGRRSDGVIVWTNVISQ